MCSIHSKNCSADSAAPRQDVKSGSAKTDPSTAGLSVQFMSPGGNNKAAAADDTVPSQRIANYAVASSASGTSAAAKKDKDAKDIL